MHCKHTLTPLPSPTAPRPRHGRGGGTRPSERIESGSRGSSTGATGALSGANASEQFWQQLWLKGLWKRPVLSWRYLYLQGWEGGLVDENRLHGRPWQGG